MAAETGDLGLGTTPGKAQASALEAPLQHHRVTARLTTLPVQAQGCASPWRPLSRSKGNHKYTIGKQPPLQKVMRETTQGDLSDK